MPEEISKITEFRCTKIKHNKLTKYTYFVLQASVFLSSNSDMLMKSTVSPDQYDTKCS